ncbi:MAG: DUF2470 domain-containing protein [Pseudomonadota bacterium]
MDNDIREGITAHMNDDHADAVLEYARHFAGVTDGQTAVLVNFDPDGMDIDVTCGSEVRRVRVPFASPIRTPGQARKVLIEMAREARGAT